jgi:hypothetical protein
MGHAAGPIAKHAAGMTKRQKQSHIVYQRGYNVVWCPMHRIRKINRTPDDSLEGQVFEILQVQVLGSQGSVVVTALHEG